MEYNNVFSHLFVGVLKCEFNRKFCFLGWWSIFSPLNFLNTWDFLSPRETILCHSSDGDVKKDAVLSVLCLLIELLRSGSLKLVLGSWVTSVSRLLLVIQMPQSSWRSTLGLQYYIFFMFIHMCFFCSATIPKHLLCQPGLQALGTEPFPHTQNLYAVTSEPIPSGCISLRASLLHNLLEDAIWDHSKMSERFE